MTNSAIVATKLSKQYSLANRGNSRYSTLRDTLVHGVRRKRLAASAKHSAEIHWALRDVDLEIPRGETVGIIGRNGAGKSTLLKILSRITPPTTGSADVFGRVGSLLEVGTGFHLELTGRENIYLSGAILGMRKHEIETNFDSIIEFAGVEKFVDTPVKHYSTGMYLRLAFAVAAHLRSEILLIDEVLSVGDAAFQQRCIGKMSQVAREGRTVLFVSHNMAAVRSLCTRGIVLDHGQVAYTGSISQCTGAYFRLIGAAPQLLETAAQKAEDPSRDIFSQLIVDDGQGEVPQSSSFAVSTDLLTPSGVIGFMLFFLLEDMDGRTLVHLRKESHEFRTVIAADRRYRLRVTLPALWLSPGLYTVSFKVLFHGDLSAGSRYVSDKFPLDVVGESSAVQTLLHPAGNWSMAPVNNGNGA